MPQRLSRFHAALLLAALSAAAARAEAADCGGFDGFRERTDLFPARITGTALRTYFVKGSTEAAGCPAAADGCRSPSYLVPGDAVLAQAARDGFACVAFVGQKGDEHDGFVPAAAVIREAPAVAGPADWPGEWLRTEAEITVKPAPDGKLDLSGDATWGALDPERARRGAVNIGAFSGVAAPDAGGRIAFDEGEKDTLPVEKGDVTDCKVWLRRLGPFLLVDDNGSCGGMNVTFGGLYRRKG